MSIESDEDARSASSASDGVAARREEAAAGDSFGARRVLLVDDDRDFADSLAALLRLEGYDVQVAYAFDAALASPVRPPPQVALVDIRLGHENGVDLVRELRRRRPDLIAVMMTAYATIEATVGALQAGAYDYLTKPFHSNDLLATLERCFERQRLQVEHERAVAALHARNRDLEVLNARLTQVLSSVHKLSCAHGLTQSGRALLAIVLDDLAADGGVIYLRAGEFLELHANLGGGGYAPRITVPPQPHSLLAEALASGLPVTRPATQAHAGIWSEDPSGCAGTVVALPLGHGGDVFGMVVLHTDLPRVYTRQDVEIAQILMSFGVAVMRVGRVNESLLQSETRLRGILDNSPSAISLTDLEGTPVLSNNQFVEWFPDGVPDDLAETGRLSDAASAIAPDLSGEGVLTRGEAVTSEVKVAPEDGALRHLLVTRFPVLNAERRPIGVGTIATDVTDRHFAEERLHHAQRMEAVGQITGGVAHDFNNLLAVVLGNLRLIEEESRGRPELIELIEDALDATRSGVELTGRLLAFGRVQPLHPEVTDLRELALTITRLLGRTLGEDITIQLELAPDLWRVRIDRSQLEAGLLNLAINARDSMSSGGRLQITARNVTLDEDDVGTDPEARAGRHVMLSVIDNGIGMSADVRQRAIQPFFTTKSAGHGSGLGLSMVYGFVRQSGGHLRIESEPARGTTISLFLPALGSRTDAVVQFQGIDMPAPRGRSELILLVEDQQQVRTLLQRQLRRLGYRVVDVADATAALARLSDMPNVDVLLTDLVLPGEMSGVQLCEKALARDPALGIIFITGYSADVVAAGRMVDAPILRKPVEPETLARAVRAAIDVRALRRGSPQSSRAENI